eukprot:1160533-Pelagomonas_calceolata.AAC.7
MVRSTCFWLTTARHSPPHAFNLQVANTKQPVSQHLLTDGFLSAKPCTALFLSTEAQVTH